MNCPNCHSEVPMTAKFCLSCAAPLLTEDTVKAPTEVTVEWLRDLLAALGYKVEIPENAEPICHT